MLIFFQFFCGETEPDRRTMPGFLSAVGFWRASVLTNIINLQDSLSEGQVPEVNPPPGVTKLNDSFWEFYSPPDEVALEVIFFHGFQTVDYENGSWKTWLARDDDEVIWPKDWLPQKLPTARILSASYASSVRKIDDMDALAENLLKSLVQDEKSDIGQKCPVFLVGHGLGGILMKQFILFAIKRRTEISDQSKESKRIKTFLDNFKGVFYYATPHNGSGIASSAGQLKNLSPKNQRLLKRLDAVTLSINEKFRTLRNKRKILTYGTAELLATSYLGGFKAVVVPETSARYEVDVDESYTNTTADHFSVCKARGPHDSSVIGQLIDFINKGLET